MNLVRVLIKSTPLHVSSQGGHLVVSEVILVAGADAKATDVDTSTPLHWAPQGWRLDTIQVPLNHGVKVWAKDRDQSTLLNTALQV